MVPRNHSIPQAPRNRFGNLIDRGDRALERIDEDHPGLPGDDDTERSQSNVSHSFSNHAGGLLLALDIEPDDSFTEVNSEVGGVIPIEQRLEHHV